MPVLSDLPVLVVRGGLPERGLHVDVIKAGVRKLGGSASSVVPTVAKSYYFLAASLDALRGERTKKALGALSFSWLARCARDDAVAPLAQGAPGKKGPSAADVDVLRKLCGVEGPSQAVAELPAQSHVAPSKVCLRVGEVSWRRAAEGSVVKGPRCERHVGEGGAAAKGFQFVARASDGEHTCSMCVAGPSEGCVALLQDVVICEAPRCVREGVEARCLPCRECTGPARPQASLHPLCDECRASSDEGDLTLHPLYTHVRHVSRTPCAVCDCAAAAHCVAILTAGAAAKRGRSPSPDEAARGKRVRR